MRLPVCVGTICSVQVWRFAEYKGFVEEGFVYFYAEAGLVQDRHLAGFYFWLRWISLQEFMAIKN